MILRQALIRLLQVLLIFSKTDEINGPIQIWDTSKNIKKLEIIYVVSYDWKPWLLSED